MTDPETFVSTLANGVQVLLIRQPQRQTAAVSTFVRSGSMHERRALNGIGHVVEHMVFKGTRRRDAHRINLDAECLGAEVNAHTDKDHSAFHLHGLPEDAGRFVRMLAELLTEPTFPADELERERQVLLQEFSEDEDDPMAMAYRLFDHACYGLHPVAQPAIGRRANVERFTQADLQRWVAQQFTGANVIIAAIGALEPEAFLREAGEAFGGLPAGTAHAVAAPVWHGGLRTRRLTGGSQTHLILGFPVAPIGPEDAVGEVAAALLGEGMSAPLMAELRERRGLVYYAACSADVLALCGELVIEASFAPDKLDEVLAAVLEVWQAQAEAVDPIHLARARRQLTVRRLRDLERPARRLESAAMDLFALGRVRSPQERLAAVAAVDAPRLLQAFESMKQAGAAVALTGQLRRGDGERSRVALAPLLASTHSPTVMRETRG